VSESGNLTGWYFPLSAANVNCENPRRKPVLHPLAADRGRECGFRTDEAGFPHPSTGGENPSQVVHRRRFDATCGFG
jgi:hypothetical protein